MLVKMSLDHPDGMYRNNLGAHDCLMKVHNYIFGQKKNVFRYMYHALVL